MEKIHKDIGFLRPVDRIKSANSIFLKSREVREARLLHEAQLRRVKEIKRERQPTEDELTRIETQLSDVVSTRAKLSHDQPRFEARSAEDLQSLRRQTVVDAAIRTGGVAGTFHGASNESATQAVKDLREGFRSGQNREVVELRAAAAEFRQMSETLLSVYQQINQDIATTNAQLRALRNQ
jgi:hypothetical protein